MRLRFGKLGKVKLILNASRHGAQEFCAKTRNGHWTVSDGVGDVFGCTGHSICDGDKALPRSHTCANFHPQQTLNKLRGDGQLSASDALHFLVPLGCLGIGNTHTSISCKIDVSVLIAHGHGFLGGIHFVHATVC